MFTRANNTLGLVVNVKPINILCNNLTIENNKLYTSVKIENLDYKLNITDLYFAKRVFKNVLRYHEKYILDKIDTDIFVFDINNIVKVNEEENEIYLDLIAEIRQDNVVVKSNVNILDIQFDKHIIYTEKNLKYTVYRTANNTIAIKVQEDIQHIEYKNCYIEDNKLKIDLTESNILKEAKVQLYRKMPIDTYFEYYMIQEKKLEKNTVVIDFETMFKGTKISYEQDYEVKIISNNKIYLMKPKNEEYDDIISEINGITIKVNKDIHIKLSPNREDVIKLGVLGSCFSRSAFNSIDTYFNPDYKDNFKIVYSDFWYSAISDNSNKVEFNPEKYKDVKAKNLNNISRLYLKDSLEQLEASSPDYVLIDFFVDAIHGVRVMEKEIIIGQNPELHKSKYYKNYLIVNSENFDFRNKDYFEKWKVACDNLIERLDKTIGLDRVILSTSFLVDKFFDKDGEVKSFIKEKKFKAKDLKYYNSIWNKMNNYFIVKAPQAKVVDMSKFKYISSYNHPVNCGPHHFESEYYKMFLRQVLKAILNDTFR